MAAENMENDHDYLASRSTSSIADISEGYDEVPIRRSRRNLLTLNAQMLTTTSGSNSDHDYLYAPVSSSQNGNRTEALGTLRRNLEAEYDIFQEDDDDGDGDGDGEAVDSDAMSREFDAISTETVISRSGASFTTTISTGSDSDATTLSDITTASHSDISVSTNATRNSVSSRSSTEASTSNAAARNVSHSDDTASTSQQQQQAIEPASIPLPEEQPPADSSVINLSSPSPPKKRKRKSSLEANNKGTTPTVKSKNDNDNDDEDDGMTCPICLDNWEMSGVHRLTSLKCGHLFGESCIRRWLLESARQSGQKVCPQCKTKATPRDLRYLYAKRLRAIDRSEEHRMRDELCNERLRSQNLELELATMKMTHAQVTQKIKSLEADNQSLKKMLRVGGSLGAASRLDYIKSGKPHVTYKLFMEKNIELHRESGCRVMKYADHHSSLIVSQKSSQGLFPGYGLRFIDNSTFKPSNFLHTSIKIVRDISLSEDQQLLAVASMEQKMKLFDLRTLQAVAQFKPAEKPIWSCAIARKENEQYIYLGAQHGSTYVYDIRYPETFLDEHVSDADCSPVIQVTAVPEGENFPGGGFLVCKLTSLWFYENIIGGGVQGTRLGVEGRLISMSYDIHNQSLLVQTRSCPRHPGARFILGKLDQIHSIPVFDIKVTFATSTNSPVMVRATQIDVDSNTLVAAYIQDTKRISIYDAATEQCIQSLSVLEVIYDTCPVYVKDMTYLAALSETKCRLYKLNSH